jgi:hypothetical protein
MDENPYSSPQTDRPADERQSPHLWRGILALLFIVFGILFFVGSIFGAILLLTWNGEIARPSVYQIAWRFLLGDALVLAGCWLRRKKS